MREVPLQGKEIGLLRAVGVTRPWIAAVYSLEATVQPQRCSGSEEGSYLRLIDFCITQL